MRRFSWWTPKRSYDVAYDVGWIGKEIVVKLDEQKDRVDLIPPECMLEVSRVLEFGAKKYSDNNWRKGFNYSRLYAAALRHLFAFWMGEDNDKESGISHLAHAMCCIMFLLYQQKKGIGTDNRWKEGEKE